MAKPMKDRLKHRIKIIQGHLRKVEQMVEDDAYCIDTMIQVLAIQKALKSLNRVVLEGHLSTCVVDQAKQGKREQLVQELLTIHDLEGR
ncbi:MAG: metal-sensing transcriptional repressor [Patescibacteria group bacterium]